MLSFSKQTKSQAMDHMKAAAFITKKQKKKLRVLTKEADKREARSQKAFENMAAYMGRSEPKPTPVVQVVYSSENYKSDLEAAYGGAKFRTQEQSSDDSATATESEEDDDDDDEAAGMGALHEELEPVNMDEHPQQEKENADALQKRIRLAEEAEKERQDKLKREREQQWSAKMSAWEKEKDQETKKVRAEITEEEKTFKENTAKLQTKINRYKALALNEDDEEAIADLNNVVTRSLQSIKVLESEHQKKLTSLRRDMIQKRTNLLSEQDTLHQELFQTPPLRELITYNLQDLFGDEDDMPVPSSPTPISTPQHPLQTPPTSSSASTALTTSSVTSASTTSASTTSSSFPSRDMPRMTIPAPTIRSTTTSTSTHAATTAGPTTLTSTPMSASTSFASTSSATAHHSIKESSVLVNNEGLSTLVEPTVLDKLMNLEKADNEFDRQVDEDISDLAGRIVV